MKPPTKHGANLSAKLSNIADNVTWRVANSWRNRR